MADKEKKEKEKKKEEKKEKEKKEKKEEKRESFTFKATKNITGKALSSSIGQSILESSMSPEASNTLATLKKIIEKKSGKEKAKEIQKNITKIVAKAYLNIKNKNLAVDAFAEFSNTLDEIFELLYQLQENYKYVDKTVRTSALERARQLLIQARDMILKIMQDKVKPKNYEMLRSIFDYFIEPSDFLASLWADQELRENELNELTLVYWTYTPKKVRKETKIWKEYFQKRSYKNKV